jgi:dephospho-CoA kinase
LTLGLTGDVGAGKSTVAAWLAARGAAVCDADHVVHALLAEAGPVARAVAEAFPSAVASGAIDRGALAAIAFAAPEALARLEAIVHPAVAEQVAAWRADLEGGVAVIDAVRLIESGMAARCDAVWLVVTDRAVRRQRLATRGWSPSEIARRMAAATPLGGRLAACDAVIDNSGTRVATDAQLARAWSRLTASPGSTASPHEEPERA